MPFGPGLLVLKVTDSIFNCYVCSYFLPILESLLVICLFRNLALSCRLSNLLVCNCFLLFFTFVQSVIMSPSHFHLIFSVLFLSFLDHFKKTFKYIDSLIAIPVSISAPMFIISFHQLWVSFTLLTDPQDVKLGTAVRPIYPPPNIGIDCCKFPLWASLHPVSSGSLWLCFHCLQVCSNFPCGFFFDQLVKSVWFYFNKFVHFPVFLQLLLGDDTLYYFNID